MALEFGQHPDVVFDRAPLISVICQVRFSPILSLLTEAGATGFQTLIRADYPKFNKDLHAEVEVGDDHVRVDRRAPIYRFQSGDDVWRASLAADFVSLETASYTNFEEFLSRTSHLLDAVQRTLLPSPSVRVGLRKVNELHLAESAPMSAWREVVNPMLLGALAVDWPSIEPAFAYSEVRFDDDDNVLVVRHGMHPERPGIYLLDQDYYTERPYDIGAIPDISSLLQHFSEGMTSFFHWALQDDFKKSLQPRQRNRIEGER